MKNCKLLIMIVIAGTVLRVSGQSSHSEPRSVSLADDEKSDRKLVYRVDPVYPQDLKRFYIGGTVRLKLVISARGTVEKIAPLGGNPALVDSSVAAVKKWKYAPAGDTTELTVNLVFRPTN